MSEFGEPSEEDVVSAVVDDLADAVIVRDAETGAVLAVNDTVERVFGYSPDAFRDLDPGAYAANPAAASDARADARRTARETGTATFRWETERRDGTTFRAESSVSVADVDGRECFVAVVRDVSDRTERERELERFAEVLTHDLRSPLNAAEAQADILRREVAGGDEWLDRLDRVHDRMSDIVEDVRTLVGEGRHVKEPERVDLDRVIADAWAAVDGEGADAELAAADGLGTVAADPTRLCRLFENLFENAIRHGGSGVRVTVAPLAEGDGVAVEDDGPGIPPDNREHVFEYGYTTADGGTGFGLNIVAAAADAHGWDVDIADSDSGGARFEITGMDLGDPDADAESAR